MILIDTSVIVAWLDPRHAHHSECLRAIVDWAGRDELAVSSVTYAELAAGGRTREAVELIWIFRRHGGLATLLAGLVNGKSIRLCCQTFLFVRRRRSLAAGI